MKILTVALVALLVTPVATRLRETPPLRVGVYDSRAVAIAFTGSEHGARIVRELRESAERAERAGDEDGAARFRARGEALQALRHRQGFSTEPVDELLDPIRSELPALAERAGVDVIVSRWAVAWVRPGAELHDVTELVVEPFAPSEQARKWIRELPERPLPLHGTDWEAIDRH